MRDINNTLAAAVLIMLISLPLGSQAADQTDGAAPSTPTTVKETLRTITSTPLTIDGEVVIRSPSNNPIKPHKTSIAFCWYACPSGVCNWYCD